MKIDRKKNAVRNMFTGVSLKLITIFFPFVIRTMIIKTIGIEYLGLNSLFTSILQILSLSELGFGSAIVFSLYKPLAEDNEALVNAILNYYRKIYFIIGVIICVVGLCLLPFLDVFISGSVPVNVNLYILYLMYLFNTCISYFFFAYKQAIILAQQRNDIDNNIATICATLKYILQILFLFLFKNYYLYVILIPIFTLVENLVRSRYIDKKFPQYKCEGVLTSEEKKELFKKVFGLLLNKLSQACRNSFDSIILSAFLGLEMLAIYQNYYYIITALLSFISILVISVSGGIGNSIAVETVEKNYSDFKKYYFIYNWLSGWCACCLLCMFQPFVTLWVGKEYTLPIQVVFLICVYFYVLCIGNVTYTYREAAGLWWQDKYRPLVESLFNLIFNFILVLKFGVSGVVLSTILSMLLVNIPWASYILYKHYFKKSCKEYLKKIFVNIILMCIISIFTYFICFLFKNHIHNYVYMLIMNGIICLIVPNLIYYLIYFNSKEFNDVKILFQKICLVFIRTGKEKK